MARGGTLGPEKARVRDGREGVQVPFLAWTQPARAVTLEARGRGLRAKRGAYLGPAETRSNVPAVPT